MARTLAARRSFPGSRFAMAVQRNALGSAFIAGLAMFGLASNGTCLAALESPPLNSRNEVPGRVRASATGTETNPRPGAWEKSRSGRMRSRTCRA